MAQHPKNSNDAKDAKDAVVAGALITALGGGMALAESGVKAALRRWRAAHRAVGQAPPEEEAAPPIRFRGPVPSARSRPRSGAVNAARTDAPSTLPTAQPRPAPRPDSLDALQHWERVRLEEERGEAAAEAGNFAGAEDSYARAAELRIPDMVKAGFSFDYLELAEDFSLAARNAWAAGHRSAALDYNRAALKAVLEAQRKCTFDLGLSGGSGPHPLRGRGRRELDRILDLKLDCVSCEVDYVRAMDVPDRDARLEEAESLLLDMLAVAKQVCETERAGFVLLRLGKLCLMRGRPQAAVPYLESAAEAGEATHLPALRMDALGWLAESAHRRGRTDEALSLCREVFELSREPHEELPAMRAESQGLCARLMAVMATHDGDEKRAARWHNQAARFLEAAGSTEAANRESALAGAPEGEEAGP